MQEVVCFNCGRIVHISPDAERCSVCGENLRELIHPAYASTYFYDRAATMAAGSDLLQALREIDRGLSYQPSSELRLLGAILSQRIGDFEQMRHHVAAVPVDDVLRTEAEWLLRAHQHRQRVQRTGTPTAKRAQPIDYEPLAPFDEDQQLPMPLPQNKHTQVGPSPRATSIAQRRSSNSRVGIYFALLLLATVTVGLLLSSRENGLAFLPWFSTPGNTEGDIAGEPVDAEVVVPVHRTDTETTQDVPVLSPTATPAVGVPGDVVLVPPEPVAESTLGSLVVNPLQPFDLAAYLNAQGRSDLAALGVIASSQEGAVRLEGFVPSFMARQDLIDLMEAAPGVSSVSGANILVRLPPTYTVAAGDTLWAISYYFYGEDKIAEIIAANRAILPASNMLTIGQELQIPAAE